MNKWNEYKLGDICSFKTGKLNSNAAVINGEYPFFTCSPTTFRINRYAFDTKAIILAGNNAEAIYSIKYYEGKFNAYQRTYIITINNEEVVNYRFLYYILNLKLNYLKDFSQGSATKFLTTGILNDIVIKLPEIEEQHRIASILSSLDDKIELNRKMNETLESIAQAIFKHWFIDFEFLNEEGKPYKSSGGKMVDSELGEIPEGWEVLEMRNLINVKDGTHDSPKPKEKGFFLVTSKHIKKNHLDYEEAYLISEEDFNFINKRSKVEQNDVLITMIGTVGNLFLVQQEKIDFAIKNVGLFKTSEKPELALYIYLYLHSPIANEYVRTRIQGSTQQYLSLETLRLFPLIKPDKYSIDIFNLMTEKIYGLIYKNQQQINSLSQLRDSLLPKLMSGKIRVTSKGD